MSYKVEIKIDKFNYSETIEVQDQEAVSFIKKLNEDLNTGKDLNNTILTNIKSFKNAVSQFNSVLTRGIIYNFTENLKKFSNEELYTIMTVLTVGIAAIRSLLAMYDLIYSEEVQIREIKALERLFTPELISVAGSTWIFDDQLKKSKTHKIILDAVDGLIKMANMDETCKTCKEKVKSKEIIH